jgi:hypothetical protein
MAESVIPIERIRREARAAAQEHANINDACPYPFGSDAAHAFQQAFAEARAALDGGPELEP